MLCLLAKEAHPCNTRGTALVTQDQDQELVRRQRVVIDLDRGRRTAASEESFSGWRTCTFYQA